mmetsp:Transcript_28825/g.90111  ORF Transcript_28825/g.90111 Transcript_28825/m.90111 type:complete len:281 (-) Transcript_28825:455-1297(-)
MQHGRGPCGRRHRRGDGVALSVREHRAPLAHVLRERVIWPLRHRVGVVHVRRLRGRAARRAAERRAYGETIAHHRLPPGRLRRVGPLRLRRGCGDDVCHRLRGQVSQAELAARGGGRAHRRLRQDVGRRGDTHVRLAVGVQVCAERHRPGGRAHHTRHPSGKRRRLRQNVGAGHRRHRRHVRTVTRHPRRHRQQQRARSRLRKLDELRPPLRLARGDGSDGRAGEQQRAQRTELRARSDQNEGAPLERVEPDALLDGFGTVRLHRASTHPLVELEAERRA